MGKDTASLNETGSGLGLYICKNIVEKMGGQINLTSKYGQGTTTTFTVNPDSILKIQLNDQSIVNLPTDRSEFPNIHNLTHLFTPPKLISNIPE